MVFDIDSFTDGMYKKWQTRSPPKELNWRLDPSESHSDWTIIVTNEENETSYHVHRCVVGMGDRGSLYLAEKFDPLPPPQDSSFHTPFTPAVRLEPISTIRLEQPVAELFPILLDFIYFLNSDIHLSTKNAVAMRHLAKYMGVKQLYSIVMDFIQTDLTTETAFNYLADASTYEDKKLVEAAKELCLKCISSMTSKQISECIELESRSSCSSKRSRKVLFRSHFSVLTTPVKMDLLRSALCSAKEKSKELECLQDKVRQYDSMSIFGVFIENAGVEEVNGLYRRDGDFHGKMKFSKDGKWEGCQERFLLYRWQSSNSTRWYIAFIPKGRVPDNRIEIDFYRSRPIEGDEPPVQGWEKNGEGKDPPPTCKIVRM